MELWNKDKLDMIEKKPSAIIQIDCDREWDDIDVSAKILFDFKTIFEKYKLKATWFAVGNDLEFPPVRDAFKSIMESGHEIGNHTYSHLKDFVLQKPEVKRVEIEKCDLAIKSIGYEPTGFRSPYFGVNDSIIKVLKDMEYGYDSSICPSPFLNNIIRLKHILNYGFIKGQRKTGNINKNTILNQICDTEISEIPISVFPYLHFPIHASYALVLPLKIPYILTEILLEYYRSKRIPLVYVFHLNDLCSNSYLKSKEFKYLIPLENRKEFINWICSRISSSFHSKLTREYVEEINNV